MNHAPRPSLPFLYRVKAFMFFAVSRTPVLQSLAPRVLRSVASYVGQVRFVPAVKDHSLSLFDIESPTETKVRLDDKVLSHAGCLLVNEITVYIIGGEVVGSVRTPGKREVRNHAESDRVDRLSLASFRVTHEPKMRYKRVWPGVVKYGRYVFVFGSEDFDSRQTCEKFDYREKQWSRLPNMTTSRGRFTPVVHKREIYLPCAGVNLEVFSPHINEFRYVSLLLPDNESHSFAGVLDGELVFVCEEAMVVYRIEDKQTVLWKAMKGSDVAVMIYPVAVGEFLYFTSRPKEYSKPRLLKFNLSTKRFTRL